MKTNRTRLIPVALALAAALLVNLAPAARANVIAHWRMEAQAATTCYGTAGVADSATAAGEGTQASGCGAGAADDPLITFNGNADTVSISATVPPASMFNAGFSGGSGSYNAEAIVGVNGALFYPQDRYGDEFNTASWTVELFFKANGNQSGNGQQQLIKNREFNDFFGLVLNEPGAGNLRLFIFNGTSWQSVDLKDRNFADGQWHFVVISYHQPTKKLSIRARSEDGRVSANYLLLSADPSPGSAGNLFLGRNEFGVSGNHRTFRGLMDEVRISSHVVADGELIGKIKPEGTNVVAHWRFESVINVPDHWGATNWARFQDYATATNQGIGTSEPRNGDLGPASPTEDYLNIWPGDTGVTLAGTVPPAAMFRAGFGGGANSYNVQSSTATAVFVPDRFGDECNTTSWTIEMFYKANGNQAGGNTDEANRMQLLRNGDWFYGLVANESSPGGLRLFAHASNDTWGSADLNDRNYSDGTWQYIVCTYDSPTKKLTLRVRSESGLVSSSSVTLQADPYVWPHPLFFGTVDDGGGRRVRGLMDEVRFSDNVQSDAALMGYIKADSTNALSSSANPALPGASITFTSAVSAVVSGNGTPTGTVQFKTNGVALGSPVALTGGVATISTAALPVGSHTVTAEYLGADTFYGSTSAGTQSVNTPPVASAITMGAQSGVTATLKIIGGKHAPTDADGHALTVSGVNYTGGNGASVSTDGTNVVYTSAANFTGADSFSYTVSDLLGGTASAAVSVTVSGNNNGQGFNQLSLEVLGGGTVRLAYLGIPGTNYALDWRTNLSLGQWMPVATNAAAASGQLIFTNTSSASENYFRTRYLP